MSFSIFFSILLFFLEYIIIGQIYMQFLDYQFVHSMLLQLLKLFYGPQFLNFFSVPPK